jgi:uncharacterized lipoprotein YddW (UPF0748 family)
MLMLCGSPRYDGRSLTLRLALLIVLLRFGCPAQGQPLAPSFELIDQPRELRGVWVASVHNMHFPSRPGLGVEEQTAELRRLVDRVAECRLNTIFFQVRPEGDALYASDLEPWSRFLTGTQGRDPGYDPLAVLLDLAHQRGLEVHAWLNPYRASASPLEKSSMVPPHLGAVAPDKVQGYGSYVWMEPTAPEVQERLVQVCRDLVRRYDLDGLHFDDYFYPYPENNLDFPDHDSWAAYDGPLTPADWRRFHVNLAIARVSAAVHREKPHVRFGISPFGLPAPERPAGIAGFDQFAKLYADPQLWMDYGYVDYLAPQLYWPTTRKEQALQPLLEWWTDHAEGGRYIFSGLNINGLGSKPEWTLDEYREEIRLIRGRASQGARGAIWWSVAPLLEDRLGQTVRFFQEIYPQPALPPPLARFRSARPQPPRCSLRDGVLLLEGRGKLAAHRWAIYRRVGENWRLQSLHPAQQSHLTLLPGRYGVTALTRFGTESPAQVVTVP